MDLTNLIQSDKLIFSSDYGKTTIINSSISDGSFLLHYLISNRLKNSTQDDFIIIISFSQTLGHYKSIQAKLGNAKIMADKLTAGDRLLFLESLNLASYNNGQNLSDQIIKIIDDKINQFIANSKSITSLTIFVDDISLPLLIGIKEYDLMKFIMKLQKLNKMNSNLVVFSQSIESLNGLFMNELNLMADNVINIDKLTTGYLKEINGKVIKNYFMKIKNI